MVLLSCGLVLGAMFSTFEGSIISSVPPKRLTSVTTPQLSCAKPLRARNRAAQENIRYVYPHIPKTGGTFAYDELKRVAQLVGDDLRLCPYRTFTNAFDDCNLIMSHFTIRENKVIDTARQSNNDVIMLTTLRSPVPLLLSSIRHMVRCKLLQPDDVPNLVQEFASYKLCRQTRRDAECNFTSFYNCSGCSPYNLIDRQTIFLVYPQNIWELEHDVLDEFHHVGIAEFRFASQCLLMYQFGVFNRTVCQDACSASQREPKNSAHAMLSFPSEIFSSLEFISRNDNILYSRALVRFIQEAECIEKQFNVRLICRNSILEGDNPVSPFKPAAYNIPKSNQIRHHAGLG